MERGGLGATQINRLNIYTCIKQCRQIGHQVFETKIIQNCNKTNSDPCLRNMSAERNRNSETISL
jgi:reverse gyrase